MGVIQHYLNGFNAYPQRNLLGHINIGRTRCYSGSGSTAVDLQGNTNFTLVGSPTYSSNNNGVLNLNGTSQYLTASAYNFTTEDFSISSWVKVNSLTTNVSGQGPVIFFKGLFNSNGYYCQIKLDGSIQFATNSPTATSTFSSAGIISANNWYNITVTKSGSSVRIYVNGTDVTTTAGSHSVITGSGNNFSVGYYGGPTPIYVNMVFSTILVYQRALSSQEANQLYFNTKNIFGL